MVFSGEGSLQPALPFGTVQSQSPVRSGLLGLIAATKLVKHCLGFDSGTPAAALRVEESDQILQGTRIRGVPQVLRVTADIDQTLIFQLLKMVR